jgi:hypothetical protein
MSMTATVWNTSNPNAIADSTLPADVRRAALASHLQPA